MKRKLIKTKNNLFYLKDGKEIEGRNNSMDGDCTGLRGDCSGLCGDCSGLRGDIDVCEITEEERKKGINIRDLVEKK